MLEDLDGDIHELRYGRENEYSSCKEHNRMYSVKSDIGLSLTSIVFYRTEVTLSCGADSVVLSLCECREKAPTDDDSLPLFLE